MDIVNLAIIALSLINTSPSTPKDVKKVFLVPTPRVAIGMKKADVIRALGEPYSSSYNMYAGDCMSYRGDMCLEGSCQVWLNNGRVEDVRGLK